MSGFTTTPNYNLRKPIVGADQDLWGGDWNINADTIDTQIKARADAIAGIQVNYLSLIGGTLTGPLTLSGPPTSALHAATKTYTDTAIGAVQAGLGTMAPQNANNVAITGGSETGLAVVGFADASQITPGGITPDRAPLQIEDASGNIATYLDAANTWHGYGASFTTGTFATLNAGTLSVTNPLTLTGLNLTSLTVAGDTWSALTTQPDLVTVEAQDTSGNIVAGFSSDGYLNVVGIKASQGVQIAGAPLGSSAVASDALDVRAAPYSAKGDGVEGWCYATTSGLSLSIRTYAGNVTLTQYDAQTAQLVITPVANSGVAFQPYDVGKSLYLSIGGYTLQATITRFVDTATVRLAAIGITPQSGSADTVTWPSFQATDLGKSMVIDGQGQMQLWLNDVTKMPDPTYSYGLSNLITTIAAVVSPTQVTLATPIPFTWTNVPTRLRWGTNDAAAIVTAGQAAYAQNRRKLYFSGDGRLYLLLGLLTGDSSRVVYLTAQGAESSAAVNGLLWVGDNTKVFACDASGLPAANHVAQIGSDTTKTADKRIFGRGSFPRCAKLQTINLLITGDSQSVYAPQNQNQSWGQCHQFVQAFKKANPTKTVNIYNCGVGGSTYAHLDDPAFTFVNNTGAVSGWIVPKPIAGTHPWYDWVSNINQTGVGSPIVPDLVVIFDNGGNDGDAIDGPSMASFINRCRNPSLHADGNGPSDVCLMTDNLAVQHTATQGNGGGVAFPSAGIQRWQADYSAGLIRSAASVRGLGCVDLAGQVQRACFGMDHMHRALRIVPGFTATGSPTAPIASPFRCLDFTVWLTLPGVSDAAVWAAMQQLDVQLSWQFGNRLMLRLGANGNLWAGVATFGRTIPTVCTISAGSTALAVAAPTSASVVFSAQTWQQLYIASGYSFTTASAGQQVILPTGHSNRAQRNFIRSFVDVQNVMVDFQAYRGSSYEGVSGTMTIGGVHFMAQDADAQADLVFFYPDGTIFSTQIVGFTDSTHVTLRDPVPQAISGVSFPLFIGRMGTKWFDAGLNLATITTSSGQLGIDVTRDTLVLGYKYATFQQMAQYADIPIERYGGTFYPVITPRNTQSVTFDHWYIDEHRPFMPNTTPWEIRGMKPGVVVDQNFYLGGIGGHPSSRIMTDVLDSFLVNQDLGTA